MTTVGPPLCFGVSSQCWVGATTSRTPAALLDCPPSLPVSADRGNIQPTMSEPHGRAHGLCSALGLPIADTLGAITGFDVNSVSLSNFNPGGIVIPAVPAPAPSSGGGSSLSGGAIAGIVVGGLVLAGERSDVRRIQGRAVPGRHSYSPVGS